MKSISLTKVSAVVIAVSMASFFVNANEVVNHDSRVTHIESSIVDKSDTNVEQKGNRFTFTSLDTDNDGKLNQAEVIAGNNEWLMQSFRRIDRNTDLSLTEQELVDFVTRSNVIIQ